MTDTALRTDVPGMIDFPVSREAKCPFNPPEKLIEAAATEPIQRVRIWDGSTPWLITGNEELRSLALDARVSTDDRLDGFPHWNAGRAAIAHVRPHSIFNSDGPPHTRLRRMMTRTFSFKRVDAQRPKIHEITDGLIDDMLAGPKPVDLVAALALPLPSFMICELLGVPYEQHEFFQEHGTVAMDRYATAEQQARTFGILRTYMQELIESRLADSESTPGVIDEFVGNIRAGEMTMDEAVALANGLLSAGHETSANMIALGTLAVLRNPEQLAILRDSDDPAVVANAVEELLRYLSIVHNGQRRIATEDIEIGGETIRAGEGIILDFASGNWDARTFGDVENLDLSRAADKHLAFGFGPHGCIGQQLARVELQAAFGTLFRRIPTLELAIPFDDIEYKSDRLAYGVYTLPVTW